MLLYYLLLFSPSLRNYSNVSFEDRTVTVIPKLEATSWRKCENRADEVSHKSTTAQTSTPFHIFTCALCLLQLMSLFYWRCSRRPKQFCLSSLIRRPGVSQQSSSRLRAKKYRRNPPDAETSLESWREVNILPLHAAPIHISEAWILQKRKLLPNLSPIRRRGELDWFWRTRSPTVRESTILKIMIFLSNINNYDFVILTEVWNCSKFEISAWAQEKMCVNWDDASTNESIRNN